MQKFIKYKGYKSPKYNIDKRTYNNIVFDSKTEMEFYKHLEQEKQAGKIVEFSYHPKEKIQYANFHCFLTNRKIKHSYTPDFIVRYKEDDYVIFDVKGGFNPSEWKIRRDWILQKLNEETWFDSSWDAFQVSYSWSYVADVLALDLEEIESVSFKEVSLDKDGNWVSLETIKKQKSEKKINRRKVVKNFIDYYTDLAKQFVKDYKKQGHIVCYNSYGMLINSLKSSEEWASYPFVKNKKLYIKKHKEIRDATNLYRDWTKSFNQKQDLSLSKYQKLLNKETEIINYNKWLNAMIKISGYKVKLLREKKLKTLKELQAVYD